MKLRRKVRQLPESLLIVLACAILPFLSRSMIVSLANSIGNLTYRFSKRERRVALANLHVVYGDEMGDDQKIKIAKRAFQSAALVILDIFWFSRFLEKRLSRHVQFDPSFDLLLEDSSAVFIEGHFGNWEILGLAVPLKGRSLTSIAMPLKNTFTDKILNRIRSMTGQIIVKRQGAIQGMLRALRNNEKAAFVIDQNVIPEEGGIFVDFMGLKVPMTKAAAKLAVRTNSKILFVCCIPDDKGDYTAYAKPILDEHNGKSDDEITQNIATVIENEIRIHPGNWLWMYKRWKYAPDGEDITKYPYYAQQGEN